MSVCDESPQQLRRREALAELLVQLLRDSEANIESDDVRGAQRAHRMLLRVCTLSTLDIVDVRHGHGTFVGAMSLDPMVEALVFRGVLSPEGSLNALREVVEVRLALDLAMADRIVEGTSDGDGAELSALAQQLTAKSHGDMLESALRGDVEGYRQAVIEHYEPLQRSLAQAR